MRLIHASSLIEHPNSLAFKDFASSQLPLYAILSHTWGDDEVVWADVQSGTAAQKLSFAKVRYSCIQTIKDGLSWVWIDSCCIDKSSSAELSEAINSMYEWYQRAEICYAHLEGVSSTADANSTTGEFAACRWFTRGWTLQELLAPTELAFYSEDWVKIGDKAALCRPLSVITGIDEEILTGARSLESASVAKRMSWASHRITTRPEDIAYCLMGIFSVNMPMLYGEGQRAFLRLQEEIMKQSDDQSLFAWANLDSSAETHHGLLARSPFDFTHSNYVMPYQDWEPRPPYQLTNRGLRIDLPMTLREEKDGGSVYIAALDCPAPPNFEENSFLAIYLKKLAHGDQQYARIRVGQFAKISERGKRQTIYVRQSFSAVKGMKKTFPLHIFQLRQGPPVSKYKAILVITENKTRPDTISSSRATTSKWIPTGNQTAFVGPKIPGWLAVVVVFERVDDRERLLVLLGSADGMSVGYHAIELPPADLDDYWEARTKYYSFDTLQKLYRPNDALRLEYNSVGIEVNTVINGAAKYHLIDINVEKTGTPDRVEEAMGIARDVYDMTVGRGNKTEASNNQTDHIHEKEDARVKPKKSMWKRLVSSSQID